MHVTCSDWGPIYMGCEIKKCHVTIFNHILKENIKKKQEKTSCDEWL